ncbi:MAG: hypothetical protein P8177_03435, partial [Gemmatimonadota bacterium]
PDLTPVDVGGTLATDGATTTVTIAYGIRNDGDEAAVDPPGPDNSAETRYYLETSDGSRTYALSSARVTPPGSGGDIDLEPGMTLWHADALIAAPGAEPASDLTRVCVEVDGPDVVRESDESNNTQCGPFPTPGQADLIMARADESGPNLVTVEIDLAMRNVGTAAAPDGLQVLAVWQSPTGPQAISLLDCAITAEQRRAGMSGGCGGIGNTAPIEPGGAHVQRGFLLFPEGVPSRSAQTVEITADACAPAAGLPAFCRVDERSEANNSITVTVRAP